MELFDSLPNVAFYAKDIESKYVRVNATFVAIHNAEHEADMLGRNNRDFHPPALAEAYLAQDRRVMDAGKPIANQVWLVLHLRSFYVGMFPPKSRCSIPREESWALQERCI